MITKMKTTAPCIESFACYRHYITYLIYKAPISSSLIKWALVLTPFYRQELKGLKALGNLSPIGKQQRHASNPALPSPKTICLPLTAHCH